MDSNEYAQALKELEDIALRVEDPQVGLDGIDKCMARSKELIEACRAYLRTAREKADDLAL